MRRKPSNSLQLARAFILAQGGTLEHTRRDDAAAHARLARGEGATTYRCLLCGTDHPIIDGRVEHAVATPEPRAR